MTVDSRKLYPLFKYTVYALLAFNTLVFFNEEFLAAKLQFPNGVSLANLIDAYAATIDTAAWVLLLLIFELETHTLGDHRYTPLIGRSLQGLRALCYLVVVYALYGYTVNLMFINQVSAYEGIDNICQLVTDGWSYAIDLDEYTRLTMANCDSFSHANSFLHFSGMPAVVDAVGFANIRNLAAVDVINAAVWLLVVLVLETDVRLQERGRLTGPALRASSLTKYVLYSTLLFAAIFWGLKGDFVDFWDAFLWLVAFAFIELNLLAWRHESAAASRSPAFNITK